MAGKEEELQGTHYRALKPCSKGPGSCVVAALMLLSLLLSLRPRPQQHNSDNHATTTTTLYSIVAVIVISIDVIIILPIALLELTRPIFRMIHFVLRVTATNHERTIKRVTTKMTVGQITCLLINIQEGNLGCSLLYYLVELLKTNFH